VVREARSIDACRRGCRPVDSTTPVFVSNRFDVVLLSEPCYTPSSWHSLRTGSTMNGGNVVNIGRGTRSGGLSQHGVVCPVREAGHLPRGAAAGRRGGQGSGLHAECRCARPGDVADDGAGSARAVLRGRVRACDAAVHPGRLGHGTRARLRHPADDRGRRGAGPAARHPGEDGGRRRPPERRGGRRATSGAASGTATRCPHRTPGGQLGPRRVRPGLPRGRADDGRPPVGARTPRAPADLAARARR